MQRKETFVEQAKEDETLIVTCLGDWVIDQASQLDRQLATVGASGVSRVRLDLGGVENLDTAGAWVLARACGRFREAGLDYTLSGIPEDRQALLDEVADNIEAVHPTDGVPRKPGTELADVVAGLGARIVSAAREAVDFVGFLGLMLACTRRLMLRRQRFELVSLLHHMQRTWLSALPIVGLLSFLIGVVTIYQGATQLERFGAQLFAVDMVAITMLREVGVLLAAIIVAGRSGSSFTAQIGTMKVRQEVDAMLATGIDPLAVLVAPRILALLITFPLLGFFGDIMGLFGGALMAWADLGIPPAAFLDRLRSAVDLGGFLVGMSKAPVFAMLIGLIGCFQGLRVEGSAAEVGRLTTRAVVQSIFLVIFADALFSILFRFLQV